MGSLVTAAGILALVWALLSYYEAATVSRAHKAARIKRDKTPAA